ncbi:MAG: FHA domain-containing protein [Acidimicrobiales bacterium]
MRAVCGACGTANDAAARLCANCGAKLDDHETDTATLNLDIITAAVPEVAVDRAQFPPETGLLIITRGPKGGSRYALDGSVITAGRDTRSDIFLDDVTVSRRHAEVYRRGPKYFVRDVGSLNGTYVNRKQVDDVELHDGDELQIGMFKLAFFHGTRRQATG